MTAIRAFIALTLDEQTREKLGSLQERLRSAGVRVRWESPEKLHITVRFLGEVEQRSVDTIAAGLLKRCADLAPVDMLFIKLGAFPAPTSPRVIWAGAFTAHPLLRVFEISEEVCVAAGMSPESRTHHPHCTIARVKTRDDVSNLTGVLNSITFDPILTRSYSLSIMKSVLHPGGSTYTRLLSIPFSSTRSIHD